MAAQQQSSEGMLCLVQAIVQADWPATPRLYAVTRGVHAADAPMPAVAQSPLWGLLRAVGLEHPELRCTIIDLAAAPLTWEQAALFDEIWSAAPDEEVRLSDERRTVPQLAYAPRQPVVSSVNVPESTDEHSTPQPDTEHNNGDVSAIPPCRLEVTNPGILDSLTLISAPYREPEKNEVTIAVHTAGLNFRDVLLAMGVIPTPADAPVPLGFECAGTIKAVGADVTDWSTGDAVLAIAPHSLSAYLTVDERLIVAVPPQWSLEEAATLPLVFLTAYYALCHVGRLQPGERVLIHAASGGVGLAALQIAGHIGAEVFATAGSDEKRAYLRSLGVQHVFDSRSLDFADQIRTVTEGAGVDMVLNSLTDKALLAGVSLLRSGGRFLELGKKDVFQNSEIGLRLLENNISFSTVDLGLLGQDRPALLHKLLRDMMAFITDNNLQPLPYRIFPVSQAQQAFSHLARAQHIGKVLIAMRDPAIPRERLKQAPANRAATPAIRPDASYLITGGSGGLGLRVARWLVEQGARSLVLVGRRAPDETAAPAIEQMRQQGAHITVMQADVSQYEQLAQVFREIAETLPPLRGVLHAAGVLRDNAVLNLTREHLRETLAPKVAGAWNVHRLTADLPLDHFVLFSSITALFGAPAQASYSAANSFLDALAHHRHRQGLPAMSINWGRWHNIGLSTHSDQAERLTSQGIHSLTPEHGLAVLETLLGAYLPQVAVLPFDQATFGQSALCQHRPTLFARIVRQQPSTDVHAQPAAPMRARLQAADTTRQRSLLELHLREQIAHVLRLRISAAQIDPHEPIASLGLDSLTALELRNRLEVSLGLTLSATLLWNYPTIATLAEHVLSKLGMGQIPSIPAQEHATPPASDARQKLQEIQALSDDEALQALLQGQKVNDV
jgi:NADPH:quinone reductase-like Zn-dependent oxidoreductase/acyl carrier protein